MIGVFFAIWYCWMVIILMFEPMEAIDGEYIIFGSFAYSIPTGAVFLFMYYTWKLLAPLF